MTKQEIQSHSTPCALAARSSRTVATRMDPFPTHITYPTMYPNTSQKMRMRKKEKRLHIAQPDDTERCNISCNIAPHRFLRHFNISSTPDSRSHLFFAIHHNNELLCPDRLLTTEGGLSFLARVSFLVQLLVLYLSLCLSLVFSLFFDMKLFLCARGTKSQIEEWRKVHD